jgi:DNA-binding CsgD family transcriptional regulator
MYLIFNGHREHFPVPDAATPGHLIARTHFPLLAEIPLRGAGSVTGELGPEDAHHHITALLWYLFLIKKTYPYLDVRINDARINESCRPLLMALRLQSGNGLSYSNTPRLTRREASVLLMLLGGLSVRQVSELLGRDLRTISSHKRNAMARAGLEHNGDLHLLGAQLYGCSAGRRPPLTLDEYGLISVIVLTGQISRAATLLGISVRTVSLRKKKIMKKLGVPHDVALYAVLRLPADIKAPGTMRYRLETHFAQKEGKK